MENKIDNLKQEIQQVIDLMASKQFQEAIEKHASASDFLDELIDHADDDDTLVELSRYQVLLNHLHQKIHNS
jgi:uncharacterized protein HemY